MQTRVNARNASALPTNTSNPSCKRFCVDEPTTLGSPEITLNNQDRFRVATRFAWSKLRLYHADMCMLSTSSDESRIHPIATH